MKNSANSKEFHTKKHHRWSSKKLKTKILESSKKKKFPLEKKNVNDRVFFIRNCGVQEEMAKHFFKFWKNCQEFHIWQKHPWGIQGKLRHSQKNKTEIICGQQTFIKRMTRNLPGDLMVKILQGDTGAQAPSWSEDWERYSKQKMNDKWRNLGS